MTANVPHLPRQAALIAQLAAALAGNVRRGGAIPGRELARHVAPLSRTLVRDYVAHVGGDPAAYRDTVPPHLFPHWSLALAARTLAGAPYPLHRVLVAGCRLEIHAELPIDEPLCVRASLRSIEDDGRRA